MEKIKNNYSNFLFYSFLGLVIFSYFFGFFINENSAGGGQADFKNTWKNVQTFKNNSLHEALKLTAYGGSEVFTSSRIPGVYILHKFLNPFTNNPDQFRLSVFLFSFLVPITFYFALKIRFANENKYSLILISSLIFLSPYFRTSAVWGNEENFALLSLTLSYLVLELFLKETNKFKKFFWLSILALVSSFCIYFDQKLAFVPLICYLIIIFSREDLSKKIYLTFIYFILAIPVFYLFFLWGGIMPSLDASGRIAVEGNLYYQHFGFAISIIAFYLFPLIFLTNNFKQYFKLNLNFLDAKIFYFFLLIYLGYFLFFYDIGSEQVLGKGVFFKLSLLLFESSIAKKLFLSIIFLISSVIIFNFSRKSFINIIIFLFLILTTVFYRPILQEYFDPLIVLIFFTYLKSDIILRKNFIKLICVFFSSFLIFSFFYYSIIINA